MPDSKALSAMKYQCRRLKHNVYQAISGENFSQSEYVAVRAIFNLLFHRWRELFRHVNLSKMRSKQAIHFINLSNVGFL